MFCVRPPNPTRPLSILRVASVLDYAAKNVYTGSLPLCGGATTPPDTSMASMFATTMKASKTPPRPPSLRRTGSALISTRVFHG